MNAQEESVGLFATCNMSMCKSVVPSADSDMRGKGDDGSPLPELAKQGQAPTKGDFCLLYNLFSPATLDPVIIVPPLSGPIYYIFYIVHTL